MIPFVDSVESSQIERNIQDLTKSVKNEMQAPAPLSTRTNIQPTSSKYDVGGT